MIKDNLKIIRKAIGISQRELGRQIKMSGQYIAKIEKGERTPTIDTLSKIAGVLNVELSELLERPKFTSEIFLEKIDKKNIISNKMINECKLDASRLKSALLNESSYIVDDYYNVGMYLGFSKGFLEKRKNIDLEIYKIIATDDYNNYINKISQKYDSWIMNLFSQNISMNNGYLSKNLIKLRDDNNISQKKLSKILGIDQEEIQELEIENNSTYSVDLIYKIASYFDVAPIKLLEWDLSDEYQDYARMSELSNDLRNQARKKDDNYKTDKYFKQLFIKPSEWEESSKTDKSELTTEVAFLTLCESCGFKIRVECDDITGTLGEHHIISYGNINFTISNEKYKRLRKTIFENITKEIINSQYYDTIDEKLKETES
ncbi:helix-turn-helix domain-containing protein [Clostridium beijerinckii]|uniref:Transcriptional regulator with XRE-family HTH domain n=1 Tax=Clostridium beijerinckii TaxID=1520 RepID=A0AAX0B083_CLOBE|nr:helix-turn-helix transcriptional regulator [Clostridium beijerinckii]NRT88730.1 transcriptional regulator with XRE-family HTH domain [Clostridium beijerinckii]NYC74185.1 transcriptional regulator with XRE-family HTH domain [Clostridium beijerinckii]